MTTTADRIDQLEEHARRAEERLRRLERAAARGAPLHRPPEVAVPAPPREAGPERPARAPGGSVGPVRRGDAEDRPRGAAPAPAAPRPTLEELLGGRVLAWVGGAAVLVGLVLLFALGVSNGWIGEGARCAIAAAGCVGLLGAGLRMHERAGRTEAARAAVATGIGGLFLTLTVATATYGLVPDVAGLALAAAIGALGVAIAVRWASPVIAALGIVGALLAPVAAGQGSEDGSLGFLAVAASAAIAVVVWQRWRWLAACVALTVTPQWLAWLLTAHTVQATLLVLVGFGALGAVAAVSTALRAPGERLPGLPAALLAVNALVLALAGHLALEDVASGVAGTTWVAGLAAAHLLVGALLRRWAADLALLCTALGVLLADVAFALATHGVAQALGWAGGAVAFAALARVAGDRAQDERAAVSGLGLHVGLAVLAAAQDVDPGTLLSGGAPAAPATVVLAALAGACLVSARLAPTQRVLLDVTGLAAAAVLAALALDGAALTAAWALEAVALCGLGAHGRGDRVAWPAGLAHLAAATVWALADQAPPTGLLDGVADLGAAALGLGTVLVATLRIAWLVEPADRRLLLGPAALGALHLASLAAVALGSDVRSGQLLLSGLWAGAGVVALVLGLRRDAARVRVAALGLLALTVAKVFVYDLATQEASYRVASFLGLGILLLGAAFAYQRLRPEAPRDLREVPGALR